MEDSALTRKAFSIALVFVLLSLWGASQANAYPPCDCTCASSCTATCVGDSGLTNCGTLGTCSASTGCGGGCLTVNDIGSLRDHWRRAGEESVQAGPDQGLAAARLTWRLAQQVEESGLGEVFAAGTRFQLSPTQVRSATLAFVSREHLNQSGAQNAFAGAPDLAVEMAGRLGVRPVSEWLQAGTRIVLVLDSNARTVTVQRNDGRQVLREDDRLELPDLVPGWSVRVGDLFE